LAAMVSIVSEGAASVTGHRRRVARGPAEKTECEFGEQSIPGDRALRDHSTVHINGEAPHGTYEMGSQR
jgi:hypothetical protein